MTPAPYILRHIQTDRNGLTRKDDPELVHVYTFFAESRKYNCRFKYIVRAEKYADCFAIKYYCTRNKHSEHKYSKVLNFFSAIEAKRIMEICASIIPALLTDYADASFAFNGSRTYDRADYIEDVQNTQRYRIYIEIVKRLFGEEIFHISHYDNSSACIFVNRVANADVESAQQRIYDMFAKIYNISI